MSPVSRKNQNKLTMEQNAGKQSKGQEDCCKSNKTNWNRSKNYIWKFGGSSEPPRPPPLATGLGLVAYGNLIGSMNKIWRETGILWSETIYWDWKILLASWIFTISVIVRHVHSLVIELCIKFGSDIFYSPRDRRTRRTFPSNVRLMTTRKLLSGFDCWSCNHLRMAVMYIPAKNWCNYLFINSEILTFSEIQYVGQLDLGFAR